MDFLEHISLISNGQWNEYKLGKDINLPAWAKIQKINFIHYLILIQLFSHLRMFLLLCKHVL